jgi:branched-chain amino acid transport system ATP-binding protein
MIEVDGVTVDFGGVRALNGVTLHAQNGEIIGLVGPNGSGKSTLFDVITGAIAPKSGSAIVDGVRVDGRPARRIAAAGVARTHQAPRLFDGMSIVENAIAGALRRTRDGFIQRLIFAPAADSDRRALEALARESLQSLGLRASFRERVDRLSEADRRRVEVTRALIAHPKLLLFDEPVAGQSFADAEKVLGAVAEYARSTGAIAIIADRDLSACARVCSRAIVMHAGRAVADGPVDELARNPEVLDAYIGVEWRQ